VTAIDLKRQVLDSLRGEMDDIGSVFQQIAAQARDHIHAKCAWQVGGGRGRAHDADIGVQ
jgi:hypothetical protein